MTERSIHEAHAELEGKIGAQGTEQRGKILQRDIARFAVASGDTNPIHTDESAARAAGYEGVPSPLLMLSSVLEWEAGPPLDTLRADGTGVGRESWLPLDGLRLMGGGQDLTFHAPALAGTEFTAQPRLESVTLKEGGGGAMILMVITTEYVSSEGVDLATCRETLIAR